MKALRFHYDLPRIAAAKVLGQVFPAAFVGPMAPIGFDEIPEPRLPGDNWVKLRVGLAGICGSDLKQVLLNGARDNPLTALISFPHVLGHEAVGRVEEVGPAVRGLQTGQRVLLDPWLPCAPRGITPPCSACRAGDHSLCRSFREGSLPPGLHLGNNAQAPGAFASHLVAHESQCLALPDDVTDEAAVLADPFCVALHSVLRFPPPPDAPALVYGLGSLGLMAVAALRTLHPEVDVYAVGRHARQCDLARELGAREIIVGGRDAVIERIATLTGAKVLRPWSRVPWLLDGVGVVYDTVGSPETLETALRITRTRGTVVVSGVEAPARFEWTPLYFKEVAVVGSNAFAMEDFRGRRVHAMEAYLELVQEGLDVTRIITHRFALEAWREAFLTLMDRRTTGAIKVLLQP